MSKFERLRFEENEMLDFVARFLTDIKKASVVIRLWRGDEFREYAVVNDGSFEVFPDHIRLSVKDEKSANKPIDILISLTEIYSITVDQSTKLFILSQTYILSKSEGLWEFFNEQGVPILWSVESEELPPIKKDNIVDLAEYKAKRYKK